MQAYAINPEGPDLKFETGIICAPPASVLMATIYFDKKLYALNGQTDKLWEFALGHLQPSVLMARCIRLIKKLCCQWPDAKLSLKRGDWCIPAIGLMARCIRV